jgi:hypothetical protein
MKEHQNQRRRHVEFSVGDWVLLRLHHHTVVGITAAAPSKLAPRFFGLYQVTERIGAMAYRLQLPPKARIHDVFHVALLKKYVGDPPGAIMLLPPLLHGRVIPTPSIVVRARTGVSGRFWFNGRSAWLLIQLVSLFMTSRSIIRHSSSLTSCLLGRREML